MSPSTWKLSALLALGLGAVLVVATPVRADEAEAEEEETAPPPRPQPPPPREEAMPPKTVTPPPPAQEPVEEVEEPLTRADTFDLDGDTLGEKTYKERINVVARQPLRHDLAFIDTRDRTSWQGHEGWRGIRDERPMIARKTLGFHAPDPHRPRHERVLLVSRGPLRGPQ